MIDPLVRSARLMDARARLSAIAERLVLDSLVADYRRGRDPTDNLNQLLELQALNRRLGIERSKAV